MESETFVCAGKVLKAFAKFLGKKTGVSVDPHTLELCGDATASTSAIDRSADVRASVKDGDGAAGAASE